MALGLVRNADMLPDNIELYRGCDKGSAEERGIYLRLGELGALPMGSEIPRAFQAEGGVV